MRFPHISKQDHGEGYKVAEWQCQNCGHINRLLWSEEVFDASETIEFGENPQFQTMMECANCELETHQKLIARSCV